MTRDRVGVRRSLGLLLAGAALASACTDDGAGQAGDTTTTVEATTTTESEPATTTTAAVPFDIEVRRAAIELLEIRNDVFMHPDPTRVSDYIADSCLCLERERAFIERFVNEGLRWTIGPVDVRAVELTVARDDEPSLTLIVREPAADLVRADGTVAEHADELSGAAYSVTLLRDSSGEWRMNGLTSIELNAETIAEVLSAGLP